MPAADSSHALAARAGALPHSHPFLAAHLAPFAARCAPWRCCGGAARLWRRRPRRCAALWTPPLARCDSYRPLLVGPHGKAQRSWPGVMRAGGGRCGKATGPATPLPVCPSKRDLCHRSAHPKSRASIARPRQVLAAHAAVVSAVRRRFERLCGRLLPGIQLTLAASASGEAAPAAADGEGGPGLEEAQGPRLALCFRRRPALSRAGGEGDGGGWSEDLGQLSGACGKARGNEEPTHSPTAALVSASFLTSRAPHVQVGSARWSRCRCCWRWRWRWAARAAAAAQGPRRAPMQAEAAVACSSWMRWGLL
jgi:hypothetical protein